MIPRLSSLVWPLTCLCQLSMANGQLRSSHSESPRLSRPRENTLTSSSPSQSSLAQPSSCSGPECEPQLAASTPAQDESHHADLTTRDATTGNNHNLAASSSRQLLQPTFASPEAGDGEPFCTLSETDSDSKDISWKDRIPVTDNDHFHNAEAHSRLSSRPASGGYISPDSSKSGQAHSVLFPSTSYDIVNSPPASDTHLSSSVSDHGHVHIVEPPPRSPRPGSRDNTPVRHDSGCFSTRENYEDQEVDVDTQARNIRARERVEIRRAQVLRTRRQVNESRREVQLLREEFGAAVAKLMKAVNELMATNNIPGLQSLAPYHESIRRIQDQLGPLEQSYEVLEMRLINEEEHLEQEEKHFYSHNNIQLTLFPDDVLDQELSPLIKPYNPSDFDVQSLDIENVLVKSYLTKVEEAEMLKGEVERLENRQYRLIQEQIFRSKHNLQLSEESQAFLEQYPDLHAETIRQLQAAEDELYSLRERCIEEDLFSESEYRYEPRDALIEEIEDEIREAHYRNPLYTAVEELSEQTGDLTQIDTWTLQMVTDSSMEFLRLLSFIQPEYDRLDRSLDVNDEWSKLVVKLWNRDDDAVAGESESGYGQNSSDNILGPSSFTAQERGTVGLDVGSELTPFH
ncbi:hypothetical protein F5884DRAFT_755119 [Xylogone sp. PMI_703]|nr:hypothetical protein F5884DRAFT_755119 [Xylogone sp. PMI_703]